MTRTEYLDRLARRLRRLPKEELDAALDYYNEYFDEAGPEREQETIESLGTPEEAADQVIMEAAIRNSETNNRKGLKGGLSALWIALLAVCAAPVALPLAGSAVVVLLCAIFVVIIVAFCGILLGGCLVVAGIISVFACIPGMVISPTSAIATMGIGFMCLGAGALITYFFVVISRWGVQKIVHSVGKGFKKMRREQHEAE